MVPATPPTSWASDLAGFRAAKDDSFRHDPDSPLPPAERSTFRGLEYWDPDPRYYLAGFLAPIDPPEPATIVTTGGVERPCEKEQVGYRRQVTPSLPRGDDGPGPPDAHSEFRLAEASSDPVAADLVRVARRALLKS